MKYKKTDKNFYVPRSRGVTLVELIFVVAILGIMIYSVSTFQSDIFSFNRYSNSRLTTVFESSKIVKDMASALRRTTSSALGAYPILEATASSFIFYADNDGDAVPERIRYFLDSNSVRMGIIKLSGSPSSYNPASEQLSVLINYVVNDGSAPLFQYYDKNYDGSSAPLQSPISVSDIRLIKITLLIDDQPTQSPIPITATTQVSLRNLKDNL